MNSNFSTCSCFHNVPLSTTHSLCCALVHGLHIIKTQKVLLTEWNIVLVCKHTCSCDACAATCIDLVTTSVLAIDFEAMSHNTQFLRKSGGKKALEF